MRHIEQINEMLQSELAIIIARELPLDNGLVTISFVDCAPDLSTAKIGVSVLPDKYSGTMLSALRKHSSLFSKELKKKLRIRQIPKFIWTIDFTEREASKIEEIFKQIKEG